MKSKVLEARGLLLSGWLIALCLCLSLTSAAQRKPNIASDVEDEKKIVPKDADKKPKETPVRRSASTNRRSATTSFLTVTFITRQSGADIFLNRATGDMQNLGKTGADGKLITRLPRGTHSVTAMRTGGRTVRQQIEVQPGRTVFGFDLTTQPVPKAVEANATPKVNTPATAEEVFARFLDPRRTDTVTIADWEVARTKSGEAYGLNPYDPLTIAQAHFAAGQVAYLRGDHGTAWATRTSRRASSTKPRVLISKPSS
jgi:hypothetical protein